MLNLYQHHKLRVTHIPLGKKGPVHKKCFKNSTPIKHWKKCPNDNIGIIHYLSRTICFDIDNVDIARTFPILRRLIDDSDCGWRWSSGRENRLKILFRISSKLNRKMRIIGIPGNAGQIRGGKNVQEVLPPSIHPNGNKYEWISRPGDKIPKLPKWLVKSLKEELDRTYQRKNKVIKAPFYVDIYNRHYVKSNRNLYKDIIELDTYRPTNGSNIIGKYIKRVGSNNEYAIVIYDDYEDGIPRAYNYSDSEGQDLLPKGIVDPYQFLVSIKYRGDEEEAKGYIKALYPKEWKNGVNSIEGNGGSLEGRVPSEFNIFRPEGIEWYDDRPYLSKDILMPKGIFGRIVKSITNNQQAVHNPDMAFWYSLVLVDYLIGTGFASISGYGCEPLYVFTAGRSGDGKTTTMHSGSLHLAAIGALGNVKEWEHAKNSLMDQMLSPYMDKKSFKKNEPIVRTAFKNKRIVKNVSTAQGLEDFIVNSDLTHGCDILYVQDEYGLKESGTGDNASRAFRAMILDYKTLTRYSHVEPRLLATRSQQQKGSGSGSGKSGVGALRGRIENENKGPKNIYCVHFNYFTTGTEESLRGVLGDKEVGQGYMQRFIGGNSRSPHFGVKDDITGLNVTLDKRVLKVLSKIVKRGNKFTGYERAMGKCVNVHIDSDAEKYLLDLRRACILGTEELATKMVENMQPLAKLRAILDWCDKGENDSGVVVTLEHVEWAHSICSCSILYFKWLLKQLRIGRKKVPVSASANCEQHVLRLLEEHGQLLYAYPEAGGKICVLGPVGDGDDGGGITVPKGVHGVFKVRGYPLRKMRTRVWRTIKVVGLEKYKDALDNLESEGLVTRVQGWGVKEKVVGGVKICGISSNRVQYILFGASLPKKYRKEILD